ncbi:hypothetical protein RF11_10919 [Thelohanellus kitauei]|uniref:Uncharacterized protein n=1 Tax=Thelohanellus kitauei TaxID=669202 RepID=A0A0C2N3S1_THEKT|nr:hypothetical protein RF11_10919 [Thelohanellus kitauei]
MYSIDVMKDINDPSTMIELKFMKDIPSPPSVLFMSIILKYYDLTNLSLLDTQEERYNLGVANCGERSSFSFSYAKTKGKRIDSFYLAISHLTHARLLKIIE